MLATWMKYSDNVELCIVSVTPFILYYLYSDDFYPGVSWDWLFEQLDINTDYKDISYPGV